METHFTFDSGRLCLDFLAAVSDRHGQALERWPTPRHLAAWCVAAGLLDRPPAVSPAQLAEAKGLRDSVFRVVQAARAGSRPAPADIAAVNEWAARPPLIPKLSADGRSAGWHADDRVAAVLGAVARDAIDLVTGPVIGRVRECAGDACSMLFADLSRPGKRQWCAMARCGNRAKKAAFRARHQAPRR